MFNFHSTGAGRSQGPLAAAALALALLPAPLLALAAAPAAGSIDFDKQIRPILAENCFACHGFDSKTRLAGLRLDTLEGAAASLPSGRQAVVPGSAAASELMKRVREHGPLQMPPAATGKRLTEAQIELLRRWIDTGANYEAHWAFKPPSRPVQPRVKNESWVRSPIDRFVLARLEKEGLTPSPEADRRTLIRRLSLDLTGLPPTLPEINRFISDTRPGAYERLVDRLLASPHYGERMAADWLDLARYADTHGFHIDSHRDMWPWRDWLVQSYNRNMPYDRFVVEQLAGDLLPDAGLEQRVATGFNRNHPINFEGGAIPEEYLAAYIFDRVDTTATAFMGLTMRCAQCHDHKYDPLTQREFYQLYAFFHNVPEQGLDGRTGNAQPLVKVPSGAQAERLANLDRELAEVERRRAAHRAAALPRAAAWAACLPENSPPGLYAGLIALHDFDEGESALTREAAGCEPAAAPHGDLKLGAGRRGQALALDGGGHLESRGSAPAEGAAFSYGCWARVRGKEGMALLSRMEEGPALRGWDLYTGDGRIYAHLIHRWPDAAIRVNSSQPFSQDEWHHFFVTYDGSGKASGVKLYLDGSPQDLQITHDTLKGPVQPEQPLRIGARPGAAAVKGEIDDVRVYDRLLSSAEVRRLSSWPEFLQARSAGTRSDAQANRLVDLYLELEDAGYAGLVAERDRIAAEQQSVRKSIPDTMVMQEMEKPRDTHILIRGQYDRPGEKVEPGVPAVLPSLPADRRPNRLDLARWLVRPDHPLTARVQVNRLWQMHFGSGLVATPENWGSQGERPSHPELLDWLATEFIRTGWDMKAMHRLMVTSSVYRQSSRLTSALHAADPANRLLARMSRPRLSAEAVRDQALAASGLLVRRLGGPPVRPYQPPGLWEELAFGGEFTAQKYEQDHGEALYRRSLYIFWKRTCPPPSLQTFDAPEREFCVVKRSATNTPLQSLVVMNDVTYVEAARKLAERMLTEVAATPADRMRYGFQLLLARHPSPAELRLLVQLYEERLGFYRTDPKAASQLLAVGESPRSKSLDAATHAALTAVANTMMNLDEAITRN